MKRAACGVVLLLAMAAQASTVVVIKKPTSAHPADVLVWWNMEEGNFDASNFYDITGSTTEYSAGDQVWAGTNAATDIDNIPQGDSPCIGPSGNTWFLDPDAASRVGSIDVTSGFDTFPQTAGRVGVWFSMTTFTSGGQMWLAKFDNSNSNRLYLGATTSNRLTTEWNAPSGGGEVVTGATTLSVDTCYFAEVVFDQAASHLRLIVHNEAGTVVDDVTCTAPCTFGAHTWATSGVFSIGSAASFTDIKIDHLIISNSKTRDLWTDFAAVLNYP